MKYQNVYNVMELIYKGTVKVPHFDYSGFVYTWNFLKIKNGQKLDINLVDHGCKKKETAPPVNENDDPSPVTYTIHGRKREYAIIDGEEEAVDRTRSGRKKTSTYKGEEYEKEMKATGTGQTTRNGRNKANMNKIEVKPPVKRARTRGNEKEEKVPAKRVRFNPKMESDEKENLPGPSNAIQIAPGNEVKTTRSGRKRAVTYKIDDDDDEGEEKVPVIATRMRKKTQTGEAAPFQCKYCKRGANTISSLKNHVRFCERKNFYF